MTTVDSKSFLAQGGYLQKGTTVNVCEVDLQKEGVLDMLPGRYCCLCCSCENPLMVEDGFGTRRYSSWNGVQSFPEYVALQFLLQPPAKERIADFGPVLARSVVHLTVSEAGGLPQHRNVRLAILPDQRQAGQDRASSMQHLLHTV